LDEPVDNAVNQTQMQVSIVTFSGRTDHSSYKCKSTVVVKKQSLNNTLNPSLGQMWTKPTAGLLF